MGVFLERACRSQLALLATGLAYHATAPEQIAQKHAEIFDPGLIETFWGFFKRRQTSFGRTDQGRNGMLRTSPADELLFSSRAYRSSRGEKCLSQNAADHAGSVCGLSHHRPAIAGAAAAPALHARHESGGGRHCDRRPVRLRFAVESLGRSLADTRGAKRAVIMGLTIAAISGTAYLSSLAFMATPLASLGLLLLGRVLLGIRRKPGRHRRVELGHQPGRSAERRQGDGVGRDCDVRRLCGRRPGRHRDLQRLRFFRHRGRHHHHPAAGIRCRGPCPPGRGISGAACAVL